MRRNGDEIEMLGTDRNSSEYYFLSREANIIYVNYSPQSYNYSHFMILKGKKNISNYIKSLNTNGIR